MSNPNQIKTIREILVDALNEELSVGQAEAMINEVLDGVVDGAYAQGYLDGYSAGYSDGRSVDDGYSELQSNY